MVSSVGLAKPLRSTGSSIWGCCDVKHMPDDLMIHVHGRQGLTAGRRVIIVLVVSVGMGLNYGVWTLIGPMGLDPATHFGMNHRQWLLLGILTAGVASLARVPVGIASDRFRAPLVLAAVTAVGAVSALALGTVASVPVLVAVAAGTGITGTALAASAATIADLVPRSWRGTALTAVSAGTALAAAAAVATRPFFSVDLHVGLLTLVVLLLCYACVVASFSQLGSTVRRWPQPALRVVVSVLGTPATRHLVTWYAVAVCGFAAFDLYLPMYLHSGYGMSFGAAAGYAAVCVGVAAACQPLAGMWCRRRDPGPLLVGSFAAIGTVLLIAAFAPQPRVLFMAVGAGLAVSVGLISGSVLAIIGSSAPIDRIGTITGIVSAIGGLIGLLTPLLLSAAHLAATFYTVLTTVLACAALIGAHRLYLRRSWITAVATFPTPARAVTETGMTVVGVSAEEVAADFADTISILSALARTQELVIVYAAARNRPGYALLTALRNRLPGHTVIAVATTEPPHADDGALVGEMLHAGALPIALLDSADPDPSVIALARMLMADRVAHLSADRLDMLAAAPHAVRQRPGYR